MAGIFLIPKSGLQVRDPADGQPLPADGKTVRDSGYWRRRLRDGDVTLGKAPAKKSGTKAAAKKES